MPGEESARTAQALVALGERLGSLNPSPMRPRDFVPSTKKLTDDGTLRARMARERSAVSAIVASGIQLLDLSEVKARYETEWVRITDIVRRVIETTIERKTSADDLFLEASLESWIVLFGDEPDAREADRRTRRIAEEISDRLAGAGDDAGLDLRPAGGLVRVHHITVRLDRPCSEIRTVRDLLLSWKRSYEAELRARQGWVEDLGQVATTWLDPEVSFRVPSARLPAGGLAAITGYRVRLELREPVEVAGAAEQDRRRSALDREALVRSMRLVAHLRRRSLSVPVSAALLDAAERRSALVEALRDGDGSFETVANAAVFIEIEEIPEDMAHARLLRMVQPFMPLVAGIFAKVDPRHPELERFEGLGSRFRGFCIDGEDLCTRADWLGLACMADSMSRRPWCLRVHNIANAEVAVALKRLPSVECVSGSAVASALSSPIREEDPGNPGRRA